MKVILFGATGMVGQGVLRECLRDDSVEAVLAQLNEGFQGRASELTVLRPEEEHAPEITDRCARRV